MMKEDRKNFIVILIVDFIDFCYGLCLRILILLGDIDVLNNIG